FMRPADVFSSIQLSNFREHPYLEQCRIISNSDAHYLEHIHEPNLVIPVEERSIQGVLNTLLQPFYNDIYF
ncbi:MAG: phosphoesterase, partial [Lachnospiraceae bacterium]|nr:phosphoesterase [Lachnospiraceae bacterium]